MSWISNYCLIEATDLDISMIFRICDWAEVAYVTVAAYPHRGSIRYFLAVGLFNPETRLLPSGQRS
jgi:hypothetical protein